LRPLSGGADKFDRWVYKIDSQTGVLSEVSTFETGRAPEEIIAQAVAKPVHINIVVVKKRIKGLLHAA
jgi:hypothetical protein